MLYTVLISFGAALLFGMASAVSRYGLRFVSPRTGASISVPSTALICWLAAPFMLDLRQVNATSVLIFAVVGVFFPAINSLLNFEATRRMGPTISSAISSTSAAFAVVTAIVFLGEPLSIASVVGTTAIIAGIVTLIWQPDAATRRFAPWVLAIPLSSAIIRGLAQTVMKFGLALWHQPFAATLIGYTLSAVVVTIASRIGPRTPGPIDRRAMLSFFVVGLGNGGGLFLTYLALATGQVAVVAPITTTAPLFTLVISHLALKEEPATGRLLAGVVITLIGVVMLLNA